MAKNNGRKSKKRAATEINNYFSAKKSKLEDKNSSLATQAYLSLTSSTSSTEEENGKENAVPKTKNKQQRPATARPRNVEARMMPLGQAPLGAFEIMPPEVLFRLFDVIPIMSLAHLALSSKSALHRVKLYYDSRTTLKRFRTASSPVAKVNYCRRCRTNHGTIRVPPDTYKEWGKFLKALTVFSPTNQRIDFVREFYEKNRVEDGRDQEILSGWGQLFMTVIANWHTCELTRVYGKIMNHNSASQLVGQFLSAATGENPELEYRVRIFFRKIFLDHDTRLLCRQDKATWLSLILQGMEVAKQGKMMALLCCEPMRSNSADYQYKVNWRAPCDTAVYSLEQARKRFKDYSDFLALLLDLSNPLLWKSFSIFSLVEELTTFPEPWAMDNFAALLLLTPTVGKIVLGTRIVSGHLEEAVLICSAMKNLAFRWPCKTPVLTALLIDCIRRCQKKEVRVRFLGELWEASLERDNELRDQITTSPREVNEERGGFGMMDKFFRSPKSKEIGWGK